MRILPAILQLGVLAATAAALPLGEELPTPTSEPPSHLLARATSFQCPVFTNYPVANTTCSATDIVLDSVNLYGRTVFFYVRRNDPLIVRMGIAGLNTRISKVKDAITKALQQYSGWCGRFKIYIGLIGEVVEGNYGQAQPVTDGTTFGHCNVLVSAANDIISVDALQRIQKSVAHEIYHCLQYAQNLAGKRKAAKGRDDWWIEGTARFMDGELYPIAPGSGVVNLGIFPEHYDPRVSIVEQPGKGYAASLFFHYLLTTGHTLSNINQWVSKKIGQKSVASDLADLAADTSPHLSFPKNWHGFAVAFASRTIKYLSSGDLIELTSNPPSVTLSRNLAVGQTRALSRSIKSFTFDVVRYTFPVNTTNSLQFPDTATTLRCSYRLRGRTFWDSARAGLSISIQPVASGTSYIDTLCSCSAATTCSDTFNIERSL